MRTLADRAQAFLASPIKSMGIIKKEIIPSLPEFARLRANLRNAKRFTISNDFLEHLVEAASVNPDAILERCAIANLPYDSVWFELDQNYRVDIQHARGTSVEKRNEDLGTAGYLLRRINGNPNSWETFEFVGFLTGNVILGQVSQQFLPLVGDGLEGLRSRIPDSAKSWMSAGWGYTNQSLKSNPHIQDLLLQQGRTLPENVLMTEMINRSSGPVMQRLLNLIGANANETRGDLRFLITLVSMINSLPIEYEYRAAEGRFSHNTKTMDYLDTSVIHLKPGKTKIVNLLRKAAKHSIKMRRHEVRGFYRVLHRGTPEERTVWVRDHLRGDAGLGFVKKEYKIE